MSLTQNRWFRRLGLGAIAAVSLGAAVMTSPPAQAHDFGYRAPVAIHHAAYFPRYFFGFGGEHRWDHQNHWDHRDYRDYHWR